MLRKSVRACAHVLESGGTATTSCSPPRAPRPQSCGTERGKLPQFNRGHARSIGSFVFFVRERDFGVRKEKRASNLLPPWWVNLCSTQWTRSLLALFTVCCCVCHCPDGYLVRCNMFDERCFFYGPKTTHRCAASFGQPVAGERADFFGGGCGL